MSTFLMSPLLMSALSVPKSLMGELGPLDRPAETPACTPSQLEPRASAIGADAPSLSSASCNLVSLLDLRAQQNPGRAALITAHEVLDFEQLRSQSARMAAGLRRAGLEKGDRAIVMLPMSSRLYVTLLALWRIGAVAVFVDPWVGFRQMTDVAAFAEPRAYIGGVKAQLLRLSGRRLRRVPITVCTDEGLFPRLFGRHSFRSMLGHSEIRGLTAVSESDPALITLTSGSSGLPKGANRTHGFLRAQHQVLAREFPSTRGDVELTSLPVFALHHLALGQSVVIPEIDFRRIDRFDAAAVLDQAEKAGVTSLTASPPFFDRLSAWIEAGTGSGPGTRRRIAPRRILSGGAPVTDAQLRSWRRAFPRSEIVIAYGSTEAEPVAHIRAEQRLALTGRHGGYCTGTPILGLHTKIQPLGAGSKIGELLAGELLVSGEHVCRGYFRNPQAERENKALDAHGRVWHRMGDTGFFDEEGRFWIAGRVHSTIFRKGRAVHAQLVEKAASGGDIRIRRAAAVGIGDPSLGERVVVVLELAPHVQKDPSIASDAARRLDNAGQLYDELLVTRRPLPLDPRHRSKIDYGRLRERLKRRLGPRGGGSR